MNHIALRTAPARLNGFCSIKWVIISDRWYKVSHALQSFRVTIDGRYRRSQAVAIPAADIGSDAGPGSVLAEPDVAANVQNLDVRTLQIN